MRIERASLSDLQTTVFDLGYVGEQNHTQVVINCISLFRSYPDAVASMIAKPPVGDLYPITVTRDGNRVVWDVSPADIAYAGSGRFQLTFTDGSGDSAEIIKTVFGSYSVKESMETTGDPPEPLEDWLERAEEALAGFDQDVSDAEAWAVGTRGGTPVGSTDPAYHNNAKYWADHLAITVSGTTSIIND